MEAIAFEVAPTRAAMIVLEPAMNAWNSLAYINVPKTRTFNSGVSGIHFCVGAQVSDGVELPAVIQFKSGVDDLVVYSIRQATVGGVDKTYFVGVTMPDFLAIKAPINIKKEIDEPGFFVNVQTSTEITSMQPLKNTETHRNLEDLFDNSLGWLATFKQIGIKNFKQFKAWRDGDLSKGRIVKVLEAGEVRERRDAAAQSGGHGAESAAGGDAAKAHWAAYKATVLENLPQYGGPIEERYITIPMTEAFEVDASALDAVKEKLLCAPAHSATAHTIPTP
jgi:hypothetical protein